jgi:hypothetical protein
MPLACTADGWRAVCAEHSGASGAYASCPSLVLLLCVGATNITIGLSCTCASCPLLALQMAGVQYMLSTAVALHVPLAACCEVVPCSFLRLHHLLC